MEPRLLAELVLVAHPAVARSSRSIGSRVLKQRFTHFRAALTVRRPNLRCFISMIAYMEPRAREAAQLPARADVERYLKSLLAQEPRRCSTHLQASPMEKHQMGN